MVIFEEKGFAYNTFTIWTVILLTFIESPLLKHRLSRILYFEMGIGYYHRSLSNRTPYIVFNISQIFLAARIIVSTMILPPVLFIRNK